MRQNFIPAKAVFVASLFLTIHTFANFDKKERDDKRHKSAQSSSLETDLSLREFTDSIYALIRLQDFGLERKVFFNAYKGYCYLQHKQLLHKTNVLTICDYSQSISSKRLYVIDLVNNTLLYNTYVSHGKNSGSEYATSFSNSESSNKSCLGFLVTADTYTGTAGYSMRLNGTEPGINDHARSRAIVLHGSWISSGSGNFHNEAIIKSQGCPAVPYGIHTKIIDAVKGGSCFFYQSS